MSPSMKVFRWILSHLTLITIVLVILYFYWSWGENKQDTSIMSSTAGSADSQIKEPVKENIQQNDKEQKQTQTSRQHSVTEAYQMNSDNVHYLDHAVKNDAIKYPPAESSRLATEKSLTGKAEPLPDPQAFSERMRQYQLNLSREERERLKSYDKALQARNRTKVMSVKAVAEPVFSDEQIVPNKMAYPEPQEINNHTLLKPVTEVAREPLGQKPGIEAVAVPSVEVSESVQKPVINENLQKQIRSRQKQLSHQMISLLSATDIPGKSVSHEADLIVPAADTQPVAEIKHNSSSVPFSVPEVKPVIITTEQKKLLAEARKAFEQGQYAIAEEKYLRLAALLPELPDVMGELANVYRAQRRMSDYVAANTRFVKRLVNHYRFKEARRVVAETAGVNRNVADKQRRIINNKQKQVGTENFIQ